MEDSNPWPWENNQWIAFQGDLPKLTIVREGWKEMEHDKIIHVKDKIAEFENREEWELRKKVMNPYEAIFSSQGDHSFPSISTNVHPLSRAYFKIIEILAISKFFETLPKRPLKSAHICEGPGGFIQYIVEQATSRNLTIDKVYAMTLKPTKHHIPGWRRSIQFLKKYPKICIEYGEDGTGDIMVPANQKAFSLKAGGAHLFTADGGFDFSVDFTNQEQLAFPLLLASFLIGLKTLGLNGTMVIKLFDIYSQATQDLILGTARLFKQFTIYKPATSRPCNSERYFIATGYQGAPVAKSWIDHLAIIQQNPTCLTRLIDGQWPESIRNAIREQILVQESQQIRMIQKTMQFRQEDIQNLIMKNIQTSATWCTVFKVPFQIPPPDPPLPAPDSSN
jgi:23S rRNA U2552 (ribose-2'-O)-methylase RlmE/FtsJ